MRKLELAFNLVVCLLLVTVLAGCQSKEDKITELIHEYGNVTVGKEYKDRFILVPNNDFKISPLTIKSINTREIGGEIRHFVKAKIVYDYTVNAHNDPTVKVKLKLFRWMALTIEEDGFGKMLVDGAKSTEYFATGEDEKDIPPVIIKNGEDLIK